MFLPLKMVHGAGESSSSFDPRGLIRFEVGTGENIHLWMDNWHPFGALVEKFGFRIVYDSYRKLDAKLSSVLKDGI